VTSSNLDDADSSASSRFTADSIVHPWMGYEEHGVLYLLAKHGLRFDLLQRSSIGLRDERQDEDSAGEADGAVGEEGS